MDDENNIVDLAKKRREKRRKAQGDDEKVKVAELYLTISNALSRHPVMQVLPNCAEHFAVFETADSARIAIVLSETGEARIVTEDYVVSAILIYTQTVMVSQPDYLLTEVQARACAKFWLMSAVPIEEPKPFLWSGEPGITFRRLPLALTDAPCPTWRTLLKRMSNVDAFVDFIGSLFVPESGRQQYLWLHGEGDDGKGAINRVLRKIFGRAYYAGQPPAGDRAGFWAYYALMGTRLVVFPDCNATTFVKGGFWKTLTGDDPIAVEIKGGAMFTYEHNAKFMFHSNTLPHISSQTSDTRRIILCSMSKEGERIPGSAEEFEAKLWQEAGFFIKQCIDLYRINCPNNEPIQNRPDGKLAIEELTSAQEEEFEVLLETEFILGPVGGVGAISCSRKLLQCMVKSFIADYRRREEFIAWLKRKHKISIIAKRENGKVIRVYGGIDVRWKREPNVNRY